jgi:hypothetical protein
MTLLTQANEAAKPAFVEAAHRACGFRNLGPQSSATGPLKTIETKADPASGRFRKNCQ